MSDEMHHGEFCWNELVTPDPKKAKEFYSALLDWKFEDMPTEGMTYTIIKKGDKGVGGLMQTPQGQEKFIPPHWMSYVYVDNLEEILKKAQNLGAKIILPIKVAGEFGRLAIIQDPTGAHIALWNTEKK